MIAGAGLQPVSAGMSNGQMRKERSRRWPETDAQPVRVWATRMWAQVMAPSTLEDLLVRMRDWPPDVVLHEEGEYAVPVAAAEAGIPWVTHGWGSPLRSARELAEIEDLASALWESCGRDVPPAAGLYAHALVNPCPPMLQDQPPPGASVVWPIRPRLIEGRGPALEADAYIGFGTVPSLANARSPLTAAVRACTSRGMRVVVTAPSEQLRHASSRNSTSASSRRASSCRSPPSSARARSSSRTLAQGPSSPRSLPASRWYSCRAARRASCVWPTHVTRLGSGAGATQPIWTPRSTT